MGITKTKTQDVRPPKIEFVEVWSQIITKVGLICQIIFCPILSTEF